MSILIKGMEMPTSCYDCNCFIRDSDGSDYCCLLMQDIEDNNKRDDDCPLSTVPPHGRLIDADAILGKINAIISAHPDEADLYEQDAVIVRDWLRSEPTIIEAEEGE